MRRFSGLCAAIVALAFLQPARADIFLLRSGGHVEGDLVNVDQNPRTSYVIALAGGGQITLEASVVEKVQTVRPELAEYDKVRRQAADTVQGQMQMADWCRDHGLKAQRQTHLDRVLQLDPDQPEVRRLLGYRKVKDKWMTHDEEMADKGYVKVHDSHTGEIRWKTPQEADNDANAQKQLKAEAEWRKKITRWRAWLDGRQAEQGKKNLLAIIDPMAIVPLGERLKKDPRYDARLIYVEVLARLDTHEARGPLAMCAMDDPVEEVRLSCLDELEKQRDGGVTAYFEGRMRDKHTTNEMINRAGVALGRIKDPSCIETLIQYLVTAHDEVIQPAGGQGSMSTTFSKNGGPSGLGMNQKPKIIRHTLQNRDVLDALVAITGQNFGYDMRAWSTWYKTQIAKGGSVEAKK